MNKCAYVEGEFLPCEQRSQYTNIETTCIIPHSLKTVSVSSNFCPFCGADIRKPEPIVKEHTFKVTTRAYRNTPTALDVQYKGKLISVEVLSEPTSGISTRVAIDEILHQIITSVHDLEEETE